MSVIENQDVIIISDEAEGRPLAIGAQGKETEQSGLPLSEEVKRAGDFWRIDVC